MPDHEDGSIPIWAANISTSVGEIRGLVSQIPDMVKELKDLRANTVPMQEHIKLMNDVDKLKERDLGARSDWEDVCARVLREDGMLATIWNERAKLQGSIMLLRLFVIGLTLALTFLTILSLLHNAGVSVSVH